MSQTSKMFKMHFTFKNSQRDSFCLSFVVATMALEANRTCDLAQENSICDRHLSAEPVLVVESICLIPWEPFKP